MSEGSSGRTGKVARVLNEYSLPDLGEELVARWTAEDDRMSLRELADYFNTELLTTRLDQQHVDMLPGEIENIYELLTDEDVTSGTRIQAENRLSEYGIDVDDLRSDFVSRQAIHTYLTKDRQESYTKPDTDDVVERRLEELQRLSSRQRAVTEQTVATLRKGDRLDLGEFQVLSSVQIQCRDCGRQFELTTLLDRGGCDCNAS
ncbi:rod-determining factor RdfA [Halohasta litorea]|uniref:Rod-determining factor RdfA n=1 Tax=Halohasta litorea TaxID=869891 RepID=A0ABD6DC28_9EURY|nr:rod-determining factor RdfA [Halohasta litorea]MEA1931661.1 hypothetical protein [Euryarchaeota archaeon]